MVLNGSLDYFEDLKKQLGVRLLKSYSFKLFTDIYINYIAGSVEILFALLLILPITRKFAATGIIVMLIVYIPTHIYMIELAPSNYKIWARLIIGQPFLILWAWWHREDRENPKGILV